MKILNFEALLPYLTTHGVVDRQTPLTVVEVGEKSVVTQWATSMTGYVFRFDAEPTLKVGDTVCVDSSGTLSVTNAPSPARVVEPQQPYRGCSSWNEVVS